MILFVYLLCFNFVIREGINLKVSKPAALGVIKKAYFCVQVGRKGVKILENSAYVICGWPLWNVQILYQQPMGRGQNLTKADARRGGSSLTDVSTCQNFILRNYRELGARVTHSIFILTPPSFCWIPTNLKVQDVTGNFLYLLHQRSFCFENSIV